MIAKFTYLKHRLGFHTKDCVIPCSHPRLEALFTCAITLKDFPKRKLKVSTAVRKERKKWEKKLRKKGKL